MSTDLHQITLRLPRSLHDKLSSIASANGRSVNAEVIQRLAASFDVEDARDAVWLAGYEQLRKDAEQTVMHDLGNHFEARIAELDAKYRNALDGSEQTFRELQEMMVARIAELEAKVGKGE